MRERILATIEKYELISPKDKIIVAVSGGADSVFLLYILKKLAKEYSLTLHIVHLNHGLRKKADKEADFVRKMAKEYNIPVTIKKTDIKNYAKKHKLSLEEAGRESRYAFLAEVAQKTDSTKIATGHTLTDEVETLFMRLARGTGRKGLTLIPPKRENIIRPLIEIEHNEIVKFLDKEKIKYETDYSNYNCDYTRNYVRHNVIPVINEFSPGFGKKIMQLREVMETEERVLDLLTSKEISKIKCKKSNNTKGETLLNLKGFTLLETAMKRRVIRKLVEKLSGKNISFEETENIIDYITKGKTGSILKSHINIIRGSRTVEFWKAKNLCIKGTIQKPDKIKLPVPGEVKVGDFRIRAKVNKRKPVRFDDKNKAYFDFNKLVFPLFIRTKLIGDVFCGQDYKKSIKRIFIDDKIPFEDRMHIPLLTDNKGILWIIGKRRAHRALVNTATKKILEIEAEKNNN